MQTTSPDDGAAPPVRPDPAELAYLRGVLEDETELAHLLRWGNVEAPTVLTPNMWLWGTRAGERGLTALLATTPLPRWRRKWGCAGELVAKCGLIILQGSTSVTVMARSGPAIAANFSDFPSVDQAIFYAMCKASIGYLKAVRNVPAASTAYLSQYIRGAEL
jgi:hypothetical protein